jgi:dihydrolipoamide dehydrogenase
MHMTDPNPTTESNPRTDTWDLIVIGAGAVGENVADYATKGGLRTVIVESELVGGECSYWACMPSKALLRPASVRLAAQRVAGASAAVTGELDVDAVLQRRSSFTSEWNDASQVSWLDSAGIDLVRGRARIVGEREVEVTQPDGSARRLVATHAVALCTGSSPTIPPIDGLADAKPWTSREATAMTAVPDSVVIVGGGVVASEFATIYRALGADVTLVVRSRLLGTLEDVASDAVRASLEGSGVRIVSGSPSRVHRDDSGRVHVDIDGTDPVEAQEIIVATGRHPATSDVGLEAVGVSPRDLRVDDSMRVAGVHGDWLYAVGDVNGRALFTHQGKYQARAAGLAIAARAAGTLSSAPSARPEPWTDFAATADHEHVPSVVFTEPEVATVGLTSTAATEAGYPVRVIDYDLGSVAGAAVHSDGYTGSVRAVIDTERRIVLGMTFVGQDVSEMLHAATIAVVGQVTLDRLWHAVPAYPTMNEVWLRLLETERYS